MAGNTEEAVLNWEKSLKIDPNYALSAYNLALVYLEKGDKSRALEYCQTYLTIKGNTLSITEREDIERIIKECKKLS